MTKHPALLRRTIDDLEIEDERSFRHVGLYADLKEVLRRGGYAMRVLPPSLKGRWDRALFLNLTFWGADAGGDVLEAERIPADVVAHAAWHHLAARAFAGGALPAEALFLGEAIASAFDVYLVGRLLGHAPESSFLETQVPAMAEAAEAAGMVDADFEATLDAIAADPERAFEDLRVLLFDATRALLACDDADQALEALARFDDHRFVALLHRYEISNWVLYAKAYAPRASDDDGRVRAVDDALRNAKVALDWLETHWVQAALTSPAVP
jgi:hypothetical protein